MQRFYDICPHPGCTKRGDFCRGFCSTHYLIFRKACMANGSWGSGTPLAQPFVIEKFEWQGDEDSLAAMAEDQERLRAIQETQDLKEEPK